MLRVFWMKMAMCLSVALRGMFMMFFCQLVMPMSHMSMM